MFICFNIIFVYLFCLVKVFHFLSKSTFHCVYLFTRACTYTHTHTHTHTTTEFYGEIHFDTESFLVSSIVHPSTYLNKVLLGSRQGALQLWNIRTNRLIYTFTGWKSPVLCLAQSTAVDIVGVGLENGTVILHNLKFDETLMKFHQEWGPVTALSFRTG